MDSYSSISEIVAPAGDMDCLQAAISAGADAVYLGLERFSARAFCSNFTREKFSFAAATAHAFYVKVYAALNTFVKDEELEDYISDVLFCWNSGADAVIVQDPFLGRYIKENYPEIVLHLSTQGGCCNSLAAATAKDFGFDRVILSRETALCDIEKISKIIDCECFVQGALCSSFSGDCYFSSFVGGNSGNRGRCKQPCRKLYKWDKKGYDSLSYRLSVSDLCVGENIGQLVEAGAKSFKIEGRMRSPEYVYHAVKYYKALLFGEDASNELHALKRCFTRGDCTKGLGFGQTKDFLSSDVQGHVGERVGFLKKDEDGFFFASPETFSTGDGLKILRDGKEVCGATISKNVSSKHYLHFGSRGAMPGDEAHITSDAKTRDFKTKYLHPNIRIFLYEDHAHILCNGEILDYEIRDKENVSDFDDLLAVFSSPVYPFSFGAQIDSRGGHLGVAEAETMKSELIAYLLSSYETSSRNVEQKRIERAKFSPSSSKKAVILDAASLRKTDADIVILKPSDYAKPCDRVGKECYMYLPPYMGDDECALASSAAKDLDGFFSDGLYGMELAKRCGKKFFGGFGLNVTNFIAAEALRDCFHCVSKELTAKEAEKISGENAFYLTGGAVKIMDLEYCPFEKNCDSCDKRSRYTLTDEDGREFPVRRYVAGGCRFEVYNCAKLETDGWRGNSLEDLSVAMSGKDFTHGHFAKKTL